MELRTKLKIKEYDFKIDYNSRGLMVGSCFVENIGAKISEIRLPVEINPTGIVYNPASIASTIERLHSNQKLKEEELFFDGHLWRSYSFHSRFCDTDRSKSLELMNSAIERGHEAIIQSDYVILTLGTARIYRLKESGEVVCNCHKSPQRCFESERMSVEQVVEALSSVIAGCLKGKHVIITVSPIRHIKDGFEENSRSKATLILAAEQLIERHSNVEYFPAYEVVMDELRDYRFYGEDMVHPSKVAVEYIWERFSEALLSESTISIAARVMKISQALSHRPFNPDSEAHKSFMERTKAAAQALSEEFPTIRF